MIIEFNLILIHLNLNRHMCLVAIALNDASLDQQNMVELLYALWT